jgi:hypothetical protein
VTRLLTLNLQSWMIFKATDEAGAVESADFHNQRKVTKRSWGHSNGMMTRNYYEQEEHEIKPYVLRHLRKHECVIVHCEKGFKKATLPHWNQTEKPLHGTRGVSSDLMTSLGASLLFP